MLVTDAIAERGLKRGGRFGIDGVRRAVMTADAPTTAVTAMAHPPRGTECSTESVVDDATLVVLPSTEPHSPAASCSALGLGERG